MNLFSLYVLVFKFLALLYLRCCFLFFICIVVFSLFTVRPWILTTVCRERIQYYWCPLEIAIITVDSATKLFTLVSKNSPLVASLASSLLKKRDSFFLNFEPCWLSFVFVKSLMCLSNWWQLVFCSVRSPRMTCLMCWRVCSTVPTPHRQPKTTR